MALVRVIFWAACTVQALGLPGHGYSSISPEGRDPPSAASGPDSAELLQPAERIGLKLGMDELFELLLAVAKTIRKLSSFVAQEADDANDDLFFLLRLAQGQLYQLRRDAPALYADQTLGAVLTAADADLAIAAEVLEQNFQFSQDLGEEFQALMDPARGRTLVRVDRTPTMFDFERRWIAGFHENFIKSGYTPFDEESSDRCLGQLSPLNLTYLETGITGKRSYCPIGDQCWLWMTKLGATGYYLTHQVLFLALGLTMDCEPDFDRLARHYFANWLPSNASQIAQELLRYQCLIALVEANEYVAIDIPDGVKDLFLEQGCLCGASVYMPEFFKPSLIRTVISWQKPSGCFGFYSTEELGLLGSSFASPDAEARIERGNLEVVEEFPVPVGGSEYENVGPSARREKPMVGNCFSHNTGMALGYLSVALRYLTD